MPKDQTKEELKVTSVEEWNTFRPPAEAGMLVKLPSGRVIRMYRTLDLPELLRSGKIPNPLADTIRKISNMGEVASIGAELQKAAEEDPEVLRQYFDLLQRQVAKVIIEPPVSTPDPRKEGEDWDDYMDRCNAWTPDEGTISIFDVPMEDKIFIFAVAQGAATDLERFREEQDSAMDAVSPSKKVVKPTKRTGGASKRSSK